MGWDRCLWVLPWWCQSQYRQCLSRIRAFSLLYSSLYPFYCFTFLKQYFCTAYSCAVSICRNGTCSLTISKLELQRQVLQGMLVAWRSRSHYNADFGIAVGQQQWYKLEMPFQVVWISPGKSGQGCCNNTINRVKVISKIGNIFHILRVRFPSSTFLCCLATFIFSLSEKKIVRRVLKSPHRRLVQTK